MQDYERSEQAVLTAALAGDERAFETIVRANADAVYGHALRFFGDVSAAEDATQEVFAKVFRSLGSFDGRSALSTWVFRVTRNVCLDMVRAGKRRPVPVDPLTLDVPSVRDFADDVVASRTVEAAIRTLPPEERDALGAVTLFGLSYEDASHALGVPVGTVKSRVFRARRALTAILDVAEGGAR
ncbi:MAG TPA: RNA polymerase sigma factor [Coriobacteriia bacterium]|nr:RNA polymerase sigma factor [Coriobacteriia bacterium]